MPKIPPMVGNYRVVSQLGQGGMARALLAIRQGPGGFRKLFVVKQLRLDFCDDPNFVAMFLDEAKLAALLNHPNVVQTHETGEDLHSRFISMEYLEGQSLGRLWGRAHRTGAMPLELSIRVIAEALSGLHYAHQLKDLNGAPLSLVHRDVSPGNLFVTYDGQVKLLDFGIAKVSGGFAQAEDGALKGKLSYMAPEQAISGDIDHRADLFAVGVILWEAIAGRRMVSRKQEDTVTINNRVSGHEPSIDDVCPDAPEGIRAICRKAMAMKPADRYATAKELRTALLQYLSSVQQSPTAEDLAVVVGELFTKERAAIAASIAKTIAADEPITIDPAVLDAWNTYTGENPLRTGEDLEIEIIAGEPTRLDNRWDQPGAKADIVIPLKTNPATESGDPAGKSGKKGLWILASGTALAAVVGTLLVLTGGEEKTGAVSEASDSQSKVVQPIVTVDVPTGDDEVQIVVSASPSNALIELDGVLIDNPYVGQKTKTSGEHILKISAQGYETQTKTISFDSKGEWKFALLKDETQAVAVGTGTIDNSVVGNSALDRGGRNPKRGGRRGSGQNVNRTPTQTVAVVNTTPEPAIEKKQIVKDESVQAKKKTKRFKMGDDLGKASTKTATKVKIDRNNPYQ